MNRPYIFCHMMTALDGKIMGSYMETPQGSAAGDVFCSIAFGKEPFYHHQGWLSGRMTTDNNFTFCKKPDLDENAPTVPAEDFLAQPNFGMFYISVAPHGKLGWESSTLHYVDTAAHVIEVLAAAADGSPDTPPVFRAQKGLSENKALGFTLKEAKAMDGGSVWLRYTKIIRRSHRDSERNIHAGKWRSNPQAGPWYLVY